MKNINAEQDEREEYRRRRISTPKNKKRQEYKRPNNSNSKKIKVVKTHKATPPISRIEGAKCENACLHKREKILVFRSETAGPH